MAGHTLWPSKGEINATYDRPGQALWPAKSEINATHDRLGHTLWPGKNSLINKKMCLNKNLCWYQYVKPSQIGINTFLTKI